MTSTRRALLKGVAAAGALQAVHALAQTSNPSPALGASPAATGAGTRHFQPQAGTWRRFEITTRVDVASVEGATRVWLPVPSIDSPWQKSLDTLFSSNGASRLMTDGKQGVRMVYTEFNPAIAKPFVEATSTVMTQNRAQELNALAGTKALSLDASDARYFTRTTHLIPLDGMVRATALKVTQGAKSDADKARAIYEWVVANAWREPKVRGCGEGDVKAMLETGNLGGKCADINALFVGLCRAVGLPARDVYGIRLAPSAFAYKELSGNASNLKGAQHCRAEVYLKERGWVAMDPADVAKVMRMETSEWIKSTANPVVQPVYRALMGGWEGNWLGWNMAHDVVLPQSRENALNFFMYPAAENEQGRFDSYSPDAFKYQISAREI